MKPSETRSDPTSQYRWVVLGTTLSAQTADGASRQGLFSLTPFFQPDLGLSRTQLGLLNSALSIGAVTALIPAGVLADRFGTRWMLLAGMVGSAAFLVGMALTHSFAIAWPVLLLSGLAHSAINPSTTRAIMYWFPARERGTALGAKQMGQPMGGAVAAALLPAVALALNWRIAVALAALVTILMALVAYVMYHEPPQTQVSPGSSDPGKGVLQILTTRGVVPLGVIAFFLGSIYTSFITYLVLYLHQELGYSAIAAGAYLALAQAAGATGRLFWGVISDRVFKGSRKPALLLIGSLTLVGCLLMGWVVPWAPEWLVIATVLIFGGASMGYSGVYLALLGELVGREASGRTTGFGLACTNVGHIVGPPVFGALLDLTQSYRPSFTLLSAGAATVIMVVALLVHEKRLAAAPVVRSAGEV